MSATCSQLSAFEDAELSAPELDAFRDHLDSCGECREHLRADRLIEQRLRALVRQQRVEHRLVGLVLALLLTAAVVGVVLAGGLR